MVSVRPRVCVLVLGIALLGEPPRLSGAIPRVVPGGVLGDRAGDAVDPFGAAPSGSVSLVFGGDAASVASHPGAREVPLGVSGARLVAPGRVEVALRGTSEEYGGLRDGTHRLSSSEIFPTSAPIGEALSFQSAPERLRTRTLELGVVAGLTDTLSIEAVLPYVHHEMDTFVGGSHLSDRSEGVGDLRVGAITHLAGDDETVLLGGLGLSLPTGSTNELARYFGGSGAGGGVTSSRRLPYAMQSGSGTYDVMPQVTLRTGAEAWTGGAQAALRVPLGNNERGYRLGRRAELTTWVARDLGASTSASLRLGYSRRANVHGADDELVPTTTPANDPNRQGGERLDLLFGLAWTGGGDDGAPSGQRLSLEVGSPLWQDLSGPQLELDRVMMIGWQSTF